MSPAKPVRKSPVPKDIEIAQAATMLPITEIAAKVGILEEELELYGRYKAKIDYMALLEAARRTSPTARSSTSPRSPRRRSAKARRSPPSASPSR